MKKIKDLTSLMIEQLRDIHNGEKKIARVLPELQGKIAEPKLEHIVDNYLGNKKEQIMRLRQVFEIMYKRSSGETCEAMETMIREMTERMERSLDPAVQDAGLITSLQHIIHYNIAGYGAVCTYAKMLGLYNVGAILHKNLEEEKRADRQLAMLAEVVVNRKAELRSEINV